MKAAGDVGSDVERAEAILDLAHADPRSALRQASDLLSDTRDREATSILQRALGMASKELNRLEEAHRHLNRAIATASTDLPVRAAQARMSGALVLLELGRTAEALDLLEQARGHLRGLDRGLLEMQGALILQRMGRMDEALAGYRRALPVFQRYRDGLRETRLRINRSAIHSYRGDLAAAEADLVIAQRLAIDLDQALLAGGAAHNLGFLRARRQEVPAALASYAVAEEAYRALSADRLLAVLATDRAELLMAVGLNDEARIQAGFAVELAEKGGNRTDTAEAVLLKARTELGAGNPIEARDLATRAERSFSRQGREAWATFGRFVALQARSLIQSGSGRRPYPGLVQRAVDLAADLAEQGWSRESVVARLIAVRLALARGDLLSARAQLDRLRAVSKWAALEVKVASWHAKALMRYAENNHGGFRKALQAGIRLVDGYRATMASDDLRAGVTFLGLELARSGLEGAVRADRPQEALEWTEAVRSVALAYPSAHPPTDAGLAQLLTSLRRVVGDLRESVLNGEPVAALEAERVRLEARIRDRARSMAGSDAAPGRVDMEKLMDELGERTLLSFFVLAETLYVIRVRHRQLTMFDIASVAGVNKEAYSLRFVIHRLTRGRGSEAAGANALFTMEHAAGLLDSMLLDRTGLADEEVVIIPAGPLHGLPWRALPRLRERSVTIAPSTRSWLQARSKMRDQISHRTSHEDGLTALLVAGPGLPGAAAEVTALGRRYPGAQKLIGARATVGAVLSGMDGADLIHLAAHGSLRHDNPLFSSLAMADGPLTVYDLESLHRSPGLVVMPSCDTALSEVVSGDELLGLSSGLLRTGVTSLIAPVAPIPDFATKSLMLALHRELARRLPPARALAAATARVSSPMETALAASFVCFGAG